MESVSNTKVLIHRGPKRAGVSPGPVVLGVPPLPVPEPGRRRTAFILATLKGV